MASAQPPLSLSLPKQIHHLHKCNSTQTKSTWSERSSFKYFLFHFFFAPDVFLGSNTQTGRKSSVLKIARLSTLHFEESSRPYIPWMLPYERRHIHIQVYVQNDFFTTELVPFNCVLKACPPLSSASFSTAWLWE